MGTNERRAREKHELRAKIMEAATELIVAEGYQHLSIRKIAEKIEYAPSTIYLYFKDKEELVQSICNELFSNLGAILKAILVEPISIEKKMEKSLRAYIEFGLQHPSHYVVTFCVPEQQYVAIPENQQNQVLSAGLECFALLSGCLEMALEQKAIRPCDVELTSQVVWAQIHGLTSLLVSMKLFPWRQREELITELVEGILRSLKA